jgi:hypothetical protein
MATRTRKRRVKRNPEAIRRLRLARERKRDREYVEWMSKHATDAWDGLAGGCRDAHGFVPVPACRGHHVPGSKTRKACPNGRVKSGPRKGRCRKHPRRK